jgi:hypothetical protein
MFNAYDEWPYGVSHILGSFSPGEYSFELTVKDRISKKQAKIIKNFLVVENKNPLKVERHTLGYYDGYNCIERRSKIFSNQETICLMPYITDFEYDSDSYIYFNMDHMILNSEGDKMSFFENAFEEKDEKTEPPLVDSFVYTSLYDYPLGEYVYEVTIKDLISKETVTITDTFFIEDDVPTDSELNDFLNKYANTLHDILNLGEIRTYNLNGLADYEIRSIYIGPEGARLMINGWVSDWLIGGETQKLPNGEMLMINNLVKTESGDAVEFAFGR